MLEGFKFYVSALISAFREAPRVVQEVRDSHPDRVSITSFDPRDGAVGPSGARLHLVEAQPADDKARRFPPAA